jgi:hypothetical protein
MNLYLKIKDTLTEDKKYRNSDKELFWRLWIDEGSVVNGCMTKELFMKATSSETLRRTRQKVVENHKDLEADPSVLERRKGVEKTGGNFVFNNSKKEHDAQWLKDAMKILVRKWQGLSKEGEDYEKDKVLYHRYKQMLKDDPVAKFEKELMST